jgi:hypothetical protein
MIQSVMQMKDGVCTSHGIVYYANGLLCLHQSTVQSIMKIAVQYVNEGLCLHQSWYVYFIELSCNAYKMNPNFIIPTF